MWWPWSKSRRELKEARRAQVEMTRRGQDREKLIRRAEQHLRDRDTFGERWTRAFGGRQ